MDIKATYQDGTETLKFTKFFLVAQDSRVPIDKTKEYTQTSTLVRYSLKNAEPQEVFVIILGIIDGLYHILNGFGKKELGILPQGTVEREDMDLFKKLKIIQEFYGEEHKDPNTED